ncbi:glycoside hydrolase superfamily [Peziza echinospora]|nr:glycoside hydrolase superfamily [Peziza echinospora]
MQFSISSAFVSAALALSFASSVVAIDIPYFSGFNLGATTTTGQCKSTADYIADFEAIRSWNQDFTVVKLFSTSDCDQLANAVPAALQTGIKIWAGIWGSDNNKFELEKGALEKAILAHGTSWLQGINVGSEALYRKEIDPWVLANQIWDVKGMVQIAYKAPNVPVGTADTWTAWVEGNTAPVTQAVDVVIMNAFPYWQGETPATALTALQTAIQNTKNSVGGKPIMIGETGWPTGGQNYGAAVPSVENLQAYYNSAGCWLAKEKPYSWLWFSAFDEPNRQEGVERYFGLAKSDRTKKISITC